MFSSSSSRSSFLCPSKHSGIFSITFKKHSVMILYAHSHSWHPHIVSLFHLFLDLICYCNPDFRMFLLSRWKCFFYLDERNVHMLRKYILLTNASILIKSWPLKTKVPLRKKFWLLNTKRHQKCRRKIQPHPLHLHLLNLWKWKQHQYNHHPICW